MNQLTTFDYSTLDNHTSEYLKELEIEGRKATNEFIITWGNILLNGQERLKNGKYGCFLEWAKSLGFNAQTAHNYMNVVKNVDFKNFEIENIKKSLLYEIAKPSADEEAKRKVLSGEVKTLKEYKELKQQLKQAQQEAEQAKKSEQIALKQLEESESKEPEVIEKEVVKEVVPDNIRKSIEEKDRYLKVMKRDYDALEQELKMLKNKQEYLDNEDKKEQEVKYLQFEADKSVLTLKLKIDDFLKEVAINSYRTGAIAASTEKTRNKIEQGIDELESFCKSMRTALRNRIELNK